MITALQFIAEFLTKYLGLGLFDKTKTLIEGIEPLIRAGLGTYFLLVILDYYRNGVQDSIIDMTKKLLGWIILSALVLNSANYIDLAKNIYEAPDKFAAVLGSEKTVNADMFKAIMLHVDNLGAKINEFADTLGRFAISAKTIVAIIHFGIYLLISLITSLAYIYYLIAKVHLALVLVVGPLFLSAMFFPTTRQYGMNWIGQCFNYIVTVMLYTALVVVMINFLESQMQKASNLPIVSLAVLLQVFITMIPMTILFIVTLFSVPSIASALTGGANIESNARKLDGLVQKGRGAFNKLRGGNSITAK